jgi:predicted Rossmann fold flavoprotein
MNFIGYHETPFYYLVSFAKKSHVEKFDVIVIGAGPAGLLAAGRAAQLGAKVLVLEKMRLPGRKLLITGKGRCNVTNSATISEFIKHAYPDGKFLKPAFSNFYAPQILEILAQHGVECTLERGGRYFPASNQSYDVLKALLTWLEKYKVEIRCGHKVDKLLTQNHQITGVLANQTTFLADKVILATGGNSYPATGSNGEGYQLAKSVGHTIQTVLPALVPLETEGNVAQTLQGLNLVNVKAVVWVNQKKMGEDFGEMLFTHFGLSGPIILTLSRIVSQALQNKQTVEITIDLKPALDEQKLEARLLRDLNEHGKKKIESIFKFWLPASMVPVFIELLELDPDKECHQLTAKERNKIRHLLKNLSFKISRTRTFKEAIITAGGISTSEIASKTMESKIVQGLFFAGEVIDVDAETGGYNLQIAYSTGWLAGESAAKQ